MSNYFLERLVADQVVKERDAMRGKLSTAKTIAAAALVALDEGSIAASRELLKQLCHTLE